MVQDAWLDALCGDIIERNDAYVIINGKAQYKIYGISSGRYSVCISADGAGSVIISIFSLSSLLSDEYKKSESIFFRNDTDERFSRIVNCPNGSIGISLCFSGNFKIKNISIQKIEI